MNSREKLISRLWLMPLVIFSYTLFKVYFNPSWKDFILYLVIPSILFWIYGYYFQFSQESWEIQTIIWMIVYGSFLFLNHEKLFRIPW